MLVSVIIATKNEEKKIENCLKSVKNQNFFAGEIEILVVDNNSSDKTSEIAQKYTEKIFVGGEERSAQRNLGVRLSLGKYIMYLDADMELSENVISESIEKMEKDNSLVALHIPEKIKGSFFWNRVRDFERSFYDGTVIDAARFLRKDIFDKAGGFDEKLTGPEDWDLDKRIKKFGKIVLIKSPLFHNEDEFNLKKYLKKKAYYSQSFKKYVAKWGENDADIKKQISFFYRLIGVFTEKGKWKKMLLHPILAAGMYFLRFLVGIVYLEQYLKKLKFSRN